MNKKIKKILVTVACMAIACVSLGGCAEPKWWTDFKGLFDKEQSSPVEDESGEKDETSSEEETEGEGEKEENGTTSEE